ncbi:MAG: CsbD family protein [Acidimicrobiales bacterium]
MAWPWGSHRSFDTGNAHLSAEGRQESDDNRLEPTVGAARKVKSTAEQAKGQAKRAAGKVVGNDLLRVEGKADEMKGSIGQAAEKVKDAFKK